MGKASQLDIEIVRDALAVLDASGGPADPPLLHVRDEKAVNTGGGNGSPGAWNTRTLNTVVTNEITGASLAANQITLPAGTYDVVLTCPAKSGARGNLVRLRDITNTLTLLRGHTGFAGDATAATEEHNVYNQAKGRITLAAPAVVEVQHFFTTATTNALGKAANADSQPEVYAEAWFYLVG